MNEHYKVFIAIPFDAATRNQYRRVCKTLNKKFKEGKYPPISWFIATEHIGPSPELSRIETFKAQNRDLHLQFTQQIRDADIVIADLTHNNPNVHLELGIALMQNKNTLRLSGRSVSELGFDIRNQDVRTYRDEKQLREMITRYLDTFFEIKKLPLSEQAGSLYCRERLDKPEKLDGMDKSDRQQDLNVLKGKYLDFRMRDGAVEVEFELLKWKDEYDSWFGVFFRAGAAGGRGIYQDLLLGSYLAYVRKNGSTEIVQYPGAQPIAQSKVRVSEGRHKLRLEVENNLAEIFVDGEREPIVRTSELWSQSPGRIAFAAYRSEAEVYSAHMVCRDTIESDPTQSSFLK